MKYGYARVSTAGQRKDGNSLADQQVRLREAGAESIVCDTYTGAKMHRPEFTKLFNTLSAGDTLIVTKLDRFARTAADGAKYVNELVERGVAVEILNMGKADNTPLGKLMVTILLAFSEYERDMIIERTQTGKAIARSRGIRVDGRPQKFSSVQLAHAMDLLQAGNSYAQVERMTGISKSTLIRQRRKIKASVGCV